MAMADVSVRYVTTSNCFSDKEKIGEKEGGRYQRKQGNTVPARSPWCLVATTKTVGVHFFTCGFWNPNH